jgi:SagB-type dehydrogenase family enzyme
VSRPLDPRARPLGADDAAERDDGADRIPTVRLAAVTGAESIDPFDPTEDYHEASRMYPGVVDPAVVGAARLERSLEVRVSASRSVKRHAQLPSVPLGSCELGSGSLAAAIDARRSVRDFGTRPVRLGELGSVLQAGYGVTGRLDGTPQELRSAPSGGALYPLELYVVARHVDGLDAGLHHFDPLRNCLERLRPQCPDSALDGLSPYGTLLRSCSAFLAMTAMFWRSRFKYGARAYRFTLLEAGHVAQNMLLAVAALGPAAVPIGGFYDREVDALLGVDGLHEASLYLLPLGAAE